MNSLDLMRQQQLYMINQELVKQVTGEDDNNRVYKLDLCSRGITHISGLRPFAKIRCLILGFNRIRYIENLECLPDLRELHLDFNQLSLLQGLDSNKMLTVLSLNNNKIQKIQNIGHLIKLETLNLDNNRIEKVSGLQTLKDLKYLSLSGNSLASIDSLPSFSKLQILNAEKNKIRKVSEAIFAKSTKLLKLNLGNNLLSDVRFVSPLTSLEQLNLSNNEIDRFEVGALKNLQSLNISNNKIQRLPRVSVLFPELATFLFASNEISSQFQVIQSLAEAEMLVEIDFRGNYMDNPDFAQTIYKLYGFDCINEKNFNKPGTRYLNKAQQIRKILHEEGFKQIENDEDVRKIIMSGFYNEDLETEMTGIKPDRPKSGSKNVRYLIIKRISGLNFEDMQKSYNEIVKNEKKLESLRNQCIEIFGKYGIKLNLTQHKQQITQTEETNSENRMLQMNEAKNLADKTSTINANDLSAKNEENINKWKELKNRQKSFNIRGAVRKISGSQRKYGGGIKEGSTTKIPSVPSQDRSDLMKTQLNPPRWNNDPSLMRTTQIRPLSSKKKEK